MLSFKGRHFPKDLILMAVRWKLAYPLSYRHIEELLEERGADVDHSIVQKWVVHYAPQLEQAFRKRKKPVGSPWKMDETYIKVKGRWVYLYRAVDNDGYPIDFMLYMNASRLQDKNYSGIDGRLQLYIRTWTPAYVQDKFIGWRS